MKYVVLEERCPGCIRVQVLGTGLPLALTNVFEALWVRYAGRVPQDVNMSKEQFGNAYMSDLMKVA